MDINNLGTTEKELICDAIKVAISPDVLKVNNRFWNIEEIMQEISDEVRAGEGFSKNGCEHELWGLVCDALEIVISPEVVMVNNRFKNQKQYLEQIVKEIEEQSGCETRDEESEEREIPTKTEMRLLLDKWNKQTGEIRGTELPFWAIDGLESAIRLWMEKNNLAIVDTAYYLIHKENIDVKP